MSFQCCTFLLLFHDLGHVSAMLFFPCVSLPSFTSSFLVKSEILSRIQWFSSSCALQTGCGFARNSHESEGGRKLYDSRQVKAISDEQTRSRKLEIVALISSTPRMVTMLKPLPSVQNTFGASNSK